REPPIGPQPSAAGCAGERTTQCRTRRSSQSDSRQRSRSEPSLRLSSPSPAAKSFPWCRSRAGPLWLAKRCRLFFQGYEEPPVLGMLMESWHQDTGDGGGRLGKKHAEKNR